jgi:thiol-disulfide isomerase/thioredoxin
MSLCLVALVVLASMGIFSAKYRRWAREAFDCVARRITLRPCVSGFDEKVKAKITGRLMERHLGLARFAHRHFEAISWVFTAVMFASLAYAIYGFYNLATVGTCDPANPGGCVFNPGGDPNRVICQYESLSTSESMPIIGGFRNIISASISGIPKVYFLGTTWCSHCAWERPIFTDVTEKFKDHADIKKVELNAKYEEAELLLFNHYSPDGDIPVIIMGGKYFRIGSGESFGNETERKVLTAFMCKITGSPITDCSNPEIKALLSQI